MRAPLQFDPNPTGSATTMATGVPQTIAVPTSSNGSPARHFCLSTDVASGVSLRIGSTGKSAANGVVLIMSQGEAPVIVNLSGIQEITLSPSGNGVFAISPLANF